MKYRILIIAVILGILNVACIKEPDISYKDLEQRSLKAWIEKHHPELVKNYQAEGGYYVEVLDAGVADSTSVTGKDVWLWYDFTGRDLDGNVCETRSANLAELLGTYTAYTHYVPAYRFSGKESHSLLEGTYLATFNALDIWNEESQSMDKFEVRYGTKLRLYLPSSLVEEGSGLVGDGGYEGEFALDSNRPMIVEMKVYGHVTNPVAYEGNRVDAFTNINGGLCLEHASKNQEEKASKSHYRRHMTRGQSSDSDNSKADASVMEFFDGRWHQAVDTMAHLYVNYAYSPATKTFDYNAVGADTLMYPMENIYDAGKIYGNDALAGLDARINQALVERFGAGISGEEVLEADSLHTQATAKIWYIGRFLDGFIFDTNIDEVREIVYGEVASAGKALEFDTKNVDENKYIPMWNHAIPTLRYGQWAALLAVSTYGYGISGQVGSHTTTEDNSSTNAYYDYMNYYNYMNYMNSYYGYGYGNMYNNGYYGYNPYYYGYNNPTIDSGDSQTVITTTTSTEIPAFSPLLFQIFVEK